MNRVITVSAMSLLALACLWGCEHDTSNELLDPGEGDHLTDLTCLGCHESEEMLQAALADAGGSKAVVPHKQDG